MDKLCKQKPWFLLRSSFYWAVQVKKKTYQIALHFKALVLMKQNLQLDS